MAHGARWRVYTRPMSGQGLVVQIAQPLALRVRLIRGMALRLAAPMLLVLPVLAGLLYGSLLSGLGTLRQGLEGLSRRASTRTHGSADAVSVTWPADLDGRVGSVDALVARLSASLTAERRFIDAAAHQLRTPLAALRLQAQQLRTETDPRERDHLLNDLAAAVDRSTTLLEQLLVLARLDAGAGQFEEQAAASEVAIAMADLAAIADQKGVVLSLTASPVTVTAPAGLVRIIAATLIDNAVRHTPRGGAVDVSVSDSDRETTLTVSDTGPGLDAGERVRAFERFHQGPTNKGGSGLGLAIVAEAARILGGVAVLSERSDGCSGLVAEVRLAKADRKSGSGAT
jgi:signal transduction histidine kinase